MVDRRRLNIAVQMDPIERINIRGDSTFALLLEAQERGHAISYYTPDRLALLEGELYAAVEPLAVRDEAAIISRSARRGAPRSRASTSS